MAEPNGGQLAILLQNWNHPVIRPFLATAATGLAAIVVYERGLPIDIDVKRLNYFVAHIAAPELGRGLYTPEKQMSPKHRVSEIVGLLEPELFAAARITNGTKAPELLGILDRIGSDGAGANFHITPDFSTIVHHMSNDSTHAHFQAASHLITPALILPSHTPGELHTITALPTDTQAQTASSVGNGSVLGFAAAGVVVIWAIFLTCKNWSNHENTKLADAQRIEDLMLQLDEVMVSKLKIETTLKAAEKSKLQQKNEMLMNKVARLKKKLDEQADRRMREKNSVAEALRKQVHEADVALNIAQERIAQLEKENTTRELPKLNTLKTGREGNNDDDLGHHAPDLADHNQQGSSQQQARPPGTSESPSNSTTTEEVSGEQSPMSMTVSVPVSGELKIPNRKRREHWYSYWKTMNLNSVYGDDVVYKMELPCFDARFSRIGIARPAENHEDRTLESGKVLEHTKCNHCLQWYTKKDMYDHLKTCKAFWELAIRCGHCKEIFKYNTAFFDEHVPDCKAQSREADNSEKHYTLVSFGVDTTTIQLPQQVGLSSSVSISPGKQTNPDTPPFTPGGSSSGLELPVSTGPRYSNPNFQQIRGTPFNGPQVARSNQFMPYMTPRGNSPAHGSGFGSPSPAARPPTGPQAYSAPCENSQAYGSLGQQQQGYPQTPENPILFSPGFIGRK